MKGIMIGPIKGALKFLYVHNRVAVGHFTPDDCKASFPYKIFAPSEMPDDVFRASLENTKQGDRVAITGIFTPEKVTNKMGTPLEHPDSKAFIWTNYIRVHDIEKLSPTGRQVPVGHDDGFDASSIHTHERDFMPAPDNRSAPAQLQAAPSQQRAAQPAAEMASPESLLPAKSAQARDESLTFADADADAYAWLHGQGQ